MTTRRKFLKKTLAGSAAFFIVPRHVLGRGYTAPSDKLGIAAIGIGGRGTSNLMNSFASNGANIVALCDVDDRRACLLYTSPSPRDRTRSRMPSSA